MSDEPNRRAKLRGTVRFLHTERPFSNRSFAGVAATGLVGALVGPALAVALTNAVEPRLLPTKQAALVLLGAVVVIQAAHAPVATWTSAWFRRDLSHWAVKWFTRKVNNVESLSPFLQPDFHTQLEMGRRGVELGLSSLATAALTLTFMALSLSGLIAAVATFSLAASALLAVAFVAVGWGQWNAVGIEMDMEMDVVVADRRLEYARSLTTDPTYAEEIRAQNAARWIETIAETASAALVRLQAHRETRLLKARGLTDLAAGLLSVAAIAQSSESAAGVVLIVSAILLAQQTGKQFASNAGQFREAVRWLSYAQQLIDAAPTTPADDTQLPADRPSNVINLDAHRDNIRTTSRLSVENLTFSYDGIHPVIRNVNLAVNSPSFVAIVGTNGSGKTSLMRLVNHQLDPTAGIIRFSGDDIANHSAVEHRQRCAVVLQDFATADLTLRENLAFGLDITPSDSDLAAALAKAGLGGLNDKLPGGFDTQLSSYIPPDPMFAAKATMLSGGQWQRLAVARVFLRPTAELVLLDEPTSKIDPESEAHILNNLRGAFPHAVVLIVTHRVSVAARADRVLVMADGHIIEDGGPRVLRNAGGTFHDFVEAQIGGLT